MATLIKSLSFKWDIWTRKYIFFVAETKQEIDACIHILEEVRRKELNRVVGESVLDSSAFAGKKTDFTLVACKDKKTGEVISCMKITNAKELKDVPASCAEYHLDQFEEELISKLDIYTRLAVLPAYRKTPAGLITMHNSFRHTLKNGGMGVLMSCEPSLLSMYNGFGLRPIGPMHNSSSGGYRIPMILFPDLDYFKKTNSPALSFAKQVDFADYQPIQDWYKKLVEDSGGIETGATFYNYKLDKKHTHHLLTDGMTKKGMDAFLKNTLLIECSENDVLMAANDGGKAFGIVRKGRVKILIDENATIYLNPGDIFGEMAYVLGTKRTADVVADEEGTEVILFSVSAIKRLENESDKIVIWQNLAKILARKLALTNELIH